MSFGRFVRSLASFAALAGTACGVPEDEAYDTTASTSEALLGAPGVTKWPNGRVPICFTSQPSRREVQAVKDSLAQSWAAVANVGFVYLNACPTRGKSAHVQLNFVPIHVDLWGSFGRAGYGVGTPNVVDIGYCAPGNVSGCLRGEVNAADYEESLRSVVIHELGHVLGFAHEQQRIDATPICPLLNDGNNTPLPTGTLLTRAYDPDSIMNYCRGWDGVAAVPYQLGYLGADLLSQGDIEGVRVAYGPRLAQPSANPSALLAGTPQTFVVSASDAFGGPVPQGEVFLNGTRVGVVGQPLTVTFPTRRQVVCYPTGFPACRFETVVAPYVLEVRAPYFTTAAVNVVVSL